MNIKISLEKRSKILGEWSNIYLIYLIYQISNICVKANPFDFMEVTKNLTETHRYTHTHQLIK